MFFEKRFFSTIEKIRSQVAIPLRIELWNGRQFDFSGSAPRVTVRVEQPSALAALWRPTKIGLVKEPGLRDFSGSC